MSTSRHFEGSSAFIFRIKQCDTAEDLHPKPLHVYPNTNTFAWHTLQFLLLFCVCCVYHTKSARLRFTGGITKQYNCLSPSVFSGFHSVDVEDVLQGYYGLCRS